MNRMAKHIVTFEAGSDQDALVLAKLGMGNRFIEQSTGLSSGKITYRLTKAKRAEENQYGYRVDWRNGNSPLLGRILRDYQGVLEREIERKIVPRIVHPVPKTIKIKET